jgi:hypothetical protein
MRKMILVPEAMLDTITRKDQQQSTAELDQVVRLDRQIEQLLSRKDLSLHQKANLYNDIVQQYLHFRNEALDSGRGVDAVRVSTVVNPATTDTTIVDDHDELTSLANAALPKTYRGKGVRLLRHMRDSGVANWSPATHEFIYDGRAISGSNISDLLYHATVPSKRAPPPGSSQFLLALREANVPRILQRTDHVDSLSSPTAPSAIVKKKTSRQALASAAEDNEGEIFEDATTKWIS